jgi:hypothetical protein
MSDGMGPNLLFLPHQSHSTRSQLSLRPLQSTTRRILKHEKNFESEQTQVYPRLGISSRAVSVSYRLHQQDGVELNDQKFYSYIPSPDLWPDCQVLSRLTPRELKQNRPRKTLNRTCTVSSG